VRCRVGPSDPDPRCVAPDADRRSSGERDRLAFDLAVAAARFRLAFTMRATSLTENRLVSAMMRVKMRSAVTLKNGPTTNRLNTEGCGYN